MPEEVRFFLRIAIFTIVITTIYWFVSYEEAGTLLLGGIIASAAIFMGLMLVAVRGARSGRKTPKSLLGFDETGPERPLELTEDVFPALSPWPIVLSLGVTLVGVGLIYGAWLWIPGAALSLTAAWGWLTER
ncbi:MAG TPA: cytochrome c oxidase subunit 4 [Actinomycetota bacterium]|nr:cytochrome c oxidase subunit 4 [Actinomycetota bacterium]